MRIDWPAENPSVECAARRCTGTVHFASVALNANGTFAPAATPHSIAEFSAVAESHEFLGIGNRSKLPMGLSFSTACVAHSKLHCHAPLGARNVGDLKNLGRHVMGCRVVVGGVSSKPSRSLTTRITLTSYCQFWPMTTDPARWRCYSASRDRDSVRSPATSSRSPPNQ